MRFDKHYLSRKAIKGQSPFPRISGPGSSEAHPTYRPFLNPPDTRNDDASAQRNPTPS
jgi:hypothetical protein